MELDARTQRRLVALVQVLGLAVWFSATAIAPSLRAEWDLTAASAVWLTASVQVGFAAGAVVSAAAGLSDRFAPQRLLAVCALGAATTTVLLAVLSQGLGSAVPLRTLTGFFLAGIYPVGMKLTASWAAPADRGRAFGVLIGALTLGSALPHLIAGLTPADGALPWRAVMLAAATLAGTAALVAVVAVRPGPDLAPSARPRPGQALQGFTERGPRLVNLGYFGHMWELYALWTWIPAYLAASAAGRGEPAGTISLATFAVVGVAGVAGAVLGGRAADRWGRPAAAVTALAVSGACCLLSPLAYAAPAWLLALFLATWGASVIADSGVFSTAMSEVADQRYVGTALTVQTAAGFALTVVTIQLVPVLAGVVGWQYAFWLLAPGPVVGALAMARLRRDARAPAAGGAGGRGA